MVSLASEADAVKKTSRPSRRISSLFRKLDAARALAPEEGRSNAEAVYDRPLLTLFLTSEDTESATLQ